MQKGNQPGGSPKLPKTKQNVTKGGDKLQASVNKIAAQKKVK